MSPSPDPGLVRRTIDLKYANRQRSASIKWILINSALFLIFTLDLWHKCPGQTSALHYVEASLAACAGAAALRHALRLAGRAPAAPRALSRAQRRLLGLALEPLEPPEPLGGEPRAAERAPPAERPASLSPPRSWRAAGGGSPRAALPAPDSPERAPRDLFIADAGQLERYLSSVSDAGDAPADAAPPAAGAGSPPPPYQLSAARAPDGGEGEPRAAAGARPPWRRLRLDPARLAHCDLNLRRWLHETILARLVREMDECDAELARAGLEARVGAASAARLAALGAGAGAAGAGARVRALLPFLRPFADQAYAARRVRELARGGCLAAYRWDGGGAGWDAARPSDAELLLHLFAAYLEGVLPGGGFAAAHVSAAPAPPPRAPAALALHRARRRPPHYAVVVGEEVVEPAPGRDNLLHALLLFVAAAARRDPPALARLHLGPAGLNLLWVLDR